LYIERWTGSKRLYNVYKPILLHFYSKLYMRRLVQKNSDTFLGKWGLII
jgi:hypothetical protein